jgi:hypothetical protein
MTDKEAMRLYRGLKDTVKKHYDSRSEVRLSDSDLKRCLDYIEKVDELTSVGYTKRVRKYGGNGNTSMRGWGSMSSDPIRRKGYRL